MKPIFLLLASCCCFLTACGTFVQTTYRFPSPTATQNTQITQIVDSTAKRFGFTDDTEAMRKSAPGAGELLRACYKRGGGFRILASTHHDSTLVSLHQTGAHTETPDFVAAENALTQSFRRLNPQVIIEHHVLQIPM